MLIVADTSPLNYLVLIDAVHVLPSLYGRILIPPEVLDELRDESGPKAVQAWAASSPQWLEVRKPASVDMTLPSTRENGLPLLWRRNLPPTACSSTSATVERLPPGWESQWRALSPFSGMRH